MSSRSTWLALAVLAVAVWISYLGMSMFSATRGLREALAPNRPAVSVDGYLEQRLGGVRR